MFNKELLISGLGICLVLLASTVLYWPVSGFGWISGMDQEVLIDNQLLHHLTANGILDLFLSSVAGLYMPLALLSLGVDLAIAVDNPVRMMHIINLVLHLLNTVLFFRLIQFINRKWAIPLLAALVFTLHPLNLDAVSWISSRGVILSSFFLITGMLLYEYYNRKQKPIYLQLIILACLAAMLAHPVGVLFPLGLLILDISQGRKIFYYPPYKIITILLSLIFLSIALLVADMEYRPGSGEAVNMAFAVWIIPARFLLPLGISGTQTGFTTDILQSAYPLVMAMSASIAYLFSLMWTGKSRTILSVVLISLWMAGIIFISFIRVGDWKNSENYWNRVIELYPNSDLAYFHRGDHWAMKGDLNRAKFDYGQSIKLNPESYKAINNLGLIYLGENDLVFAINEFRRSISIKPDFYKPHLNMGLAYMRRGENDRALESMNRAISLNPQESVAYYNRGLIYERKDSLDRAIIDFSSAIKLDPYRYIFYKDRGKALVWKRMYAEAEKDFSKALDLDDSDPEMWFRRSLARVSQDKFREGLEDALVARSLGMEVSEDFLKGLTRQILESDSAFLK
jgi:tetratricopeptide (TPR) repeat protein